MFDLFVSFDFVSVFLSAVLMCTFDDTEGEWTEVPSRKKLKAKKETCEPQENKTSSETADSVQQVFSIIFIVVVVVVVVVVVTCTVRSTVGRTPVFGQRTDPVLRSACS